MPRDQQLKPSSELAQHGLRYPNESHEYRKAREALLRDEQELVAKLKSVAEKRRNLPFGGQLKRLPPSSGPAAARSGSASNSPSCSATRPRCCSTHGCSARAGTSPAHPARR